ncbi:unannotated protein [freshwater metagenome]|uniref:Unannotated protein n=1 Tax=freshwater metagenome TaxID=449393 RepID=A0A6J7QRS5_9ZZZZ
MSDGGSGDVFRALFGTGRIVSTRECGVLVVTG